ncbi:hypothetical protein [Longimicrobium sp.]|uniref:hypothetical protein n=1 Tax=Longimicrobium sp. TaxID=2029185 RepID=UPI002E2EF288|nr:hypothetical protein [Longimicrobium sp.]HEX6039605.1 hypothetical protein [Longimicrobium sp.]
MRSLLAIALLPALLSASARSTPTADAADQRCHPSYPDFCIAPPPPDLDCPDIPANRKPFRVRHDVRNPDPHGFDRDRDGRACEPRPRARRG